MFTAALLRLAMYISRGWVSGFDRKKKKEIVQGSGIISTNITGRSASAHQSLKGLSIKYVREDSTVQGNKKKVGHPSIIRSY